MESYTIVVSDADILSQLCGTNDSNLRLIEEYLGVCVFTRGNELSLSDANTKIKEQFKEVITSITDEINKGIEPCHDMIRSILVSIGNPHQNDDHPDNQNTSNAMTDNYIQIPNGLKRIYPKSFNQSDLIQRVRQQNLVFCTGPAGSGKTFIAVAEALRLLLEGKKHKLVLTRPVVEAGESLGFLPGDLEQKIHPYLMPFYDAMEVLLPREVIRRLEENKMIEIAPLAYMRGRTLSESIILLDEAQNTTPEQMKMFLTRMGINSKIIVTGDLTQVDLPRKIQSGLHHALSVLQNIPEISYIKMTAQDVMRNPLVKQIVLAYESESENGYF
ncbi:MAG: PhoH family protein [Treponemataceae bacterium]